MILSNNMGETVITTLVFGFTVAVMAAFLIRCLSREHRRFAILVLIFLPLLSFGLYLWRGEPGLSGAPAFFEAKESPRAQKRALAQQELALIQALAQQPDNLNLMLSLGSLRVKIGRPEDAIVILEQGLEKAPENEEILTEIGAAYYALGISDLLLSGDRVKALKNMEQSLKYAPENAPYRKELIKKIETLRKS